MISRSSLRGSTNETINEKAHNLSFISPWNKTVSEKIDYIKQHRLINRTFPYVFRTMVLANL